MIQIVYYILFAITLLYGLYFLITGLFAFKGDNKDIKKARPKTKFAIIIAARNESKVIAPLIKSLKEQNYPTNLYDIYSAINNCTDNTLEVAKKAGSKIINVNVLVKSKGDVLKFVFNRLKKTDYDAYIIFDADNVVHPDFLQKMNDAYLSGYKVAQGRKDSKNISDNWLSTSYSLFYYIQNFFFNKSRMKMNAAAAINGTGFMVSKSVIDSGFDPKTVTEDIELSIMCVLKGINVAYIEDAITYDEQPVRFIDSWHQRSRWSKGIIECNRLYRKDLLKKFFKEGDFSSLDKFLFSAAPHVQVLALFLTIVLGIFYLVGVELNDIFSYFFSLGYVFFMITYLLGVILNMFVLIYYKRDIYETLEGIFLFTVFILTWIPINVICLFKKNLKWVPIEHNKSANVEVLLNQK
jgi:cellulose synthase/poly-beta-1,6-N-acetylglucosamine synthase-like glycosyltransferase